MASTTHLATPEDDARHVPGKDSLPLWNESYWFPFYDPRTEIDAPGHRDHSWGGERDWAKFHRWNYLSGEIEPDFWFNAVRIDLGTETDLRIGGLWDGRELLDLRDIEIKVETVDAGTRQTGVTTRLVDERGREHRIVGEEVLVNCPVQFGRTWLKDGITRYRYGDRIGYGILEHGYVEER